MPESARPQSSSDAPFAVMQLDHVVLRARDVGRLVRFYCDVLGCRPEREAADLGLFQLRAGTALIDVVAAAGSLGRAGGAPPAPNRGHNVDHICLRIEPFEPRALLAHLNAHGVTASEVRQVYGAEGLGPSVYIDDPEGNTVELKGPAGAQAP